MRGPEARRPFNPRAFVSSMIAFSAAGLPVTGIANHLLQAEPFSVARHAWMSAHNSLGVLFVIFAAWHVVLNRRALAGYLRSVTVRVPAGSREAVCALLLLTVTTAFVVAHALVLR